MYKLLNPEALGYIANETRNQDFTFSLEGVDVELIQYYLDNNIISYGND